MKWAIDVAVAVVVKIYEVSVITRRWLHLSTAGEAFSCGAAPQARRVPKAFLQPSEPCGEPSDSAAPPGFQKDFLRILLAFQEIMSLTGGLELIFFFGRAAQPCKTSTKYFWMPRRKNPHRTFQWEVASRSIDRNGEPHRLSLLHGGNHHFFLMILCWEKVGFAGIIPFSIPSLGACLGRPHSASDFFAPTRPPLLLRCRPHLWQPSPVSYSPSPVTLTTPSPHPHNPHDWPHRYCLLIVTPPARTRL